VEARDIRVGSKVGGRIDKVLVREGDRVQPGQTLITFDDKELLASLDQTRAAAEKAQRGYRPEEIAEARAAAAQAKADYELRLNGYRKEDIAAAQSDVERAAADEARARLDFQRYEALAQKDLVSKQQRDTAEANWKMALAQQQNYQHKLDELRRGYRPEEIASAEAHYRETKATLDKFEKGNRREDVELAKAAYAYDEARFRERQVTAPSAAIVEVLDVRPGDIIAPNTPVATLLEQDQIYVRIYIPETELGRVQLGQKAEVRVDSFPKTVFDGIVEQINQQAEFLPRNVQTREERVHQVFGVKIRINDPAGHVLAGMAADVKLKAGN
jgi:multidrug resistance efflux pump